jgi:hypothetical protein
MAHARGHPATAGPERASRGPGRRAPGEQTAWVGWVVFGATMMVLLGLFHLIAGLVALLDASSLAVPHRDLVIDVGYAAWGWVHLAGGLVALVAGVGLLTGATWARVLGVVVAMLSAIVNLGFLAASPGWALIMIVLDVLVIYAVTVHGREIRNDV